MYVKTGDIHRRGTVQCGDNWVSQRKCYKREERLKGGRPGAPDHARSEWLLTVTFVEVKNRISTVSGTTEESVLMKLDLDEHQSWPPKASGSYGVRKRLARHTKCIRKEGGC